MKLNKKGQVLENLGGLAIGVVAFCIIIVITFLIMSQGKTVSTGLIDTTTYLNQTKSITNNTLYSFNECIDNENMGIIQVYNSSGDGGVPITSGNYSSTLNTFTMNCWGFACEGTSINISYTCKTPSYAYNSTRTLQSATAGVPGWIPIIIITSIGAVLIGMVGLLRRNQ